MVVKEFFQRIHGFKADVDDLGAGAQLAFAYASDQIFRTMRQ